MSENETKRWDGCTKFGFWISKLNMNLTTTARPIPVDLRPLWGNYRQCRHSEAYWPVEIPAWIRRRRIARRAWAFSWKCWRLRTQHVSNAKTDLIRFRTALWERNGANGPTGQRWTERERKKRTSELKVRRIIVFLSFSLFFFPFHR